MFDISFYSSVAKIHYQNYRWPFSATLMAGYRSGHDKRIYKCASMALVLL